MQAQETNKCDISIDQNEISRKLTLIIGFLSAYLILISVITLFLLFDLMPKVKQALSITERMEKRVDEIGLIIKPVFESGAAKAAETINKLDPNDIGKEVKETAKSVIDKASDAALKRLIPDRTPQND